MGTVWELKRRYGAANRLTRRAGAKDERERMMGGSLIKIRPKHEREAIRKRFDQEEMIRSSGIALEKLEKDQLRAMQKLADICQHIERIKGMKETAEKALSEMDPRP